jgi:hypothetical protein
LHFSCFTIFYKCPYERPSIVEASVYGTINSVIPKTEDGQMAILAYIDLPRFTIRVDVLNYSRTMIEQ